MDLSVLTLVAFALFPVCVIYAGVSDLLSMTIPNWIPATLVVGFMVLAPFIGLDLKAIGIHWAIASAVLLIGFGCFAMGWVGGGDAKLAAAIALWLDPMNAAVFVGMSAVIGGGLTLLLITFRRVILPMPVVRASWVARLHHPDEGVPYGIALAIAALIIYPDTAWIALAS
jgi:prepilin peptidase CpaA